MIPTTLRYSTLFTVRKAVGSRVSGELGPLAKSARGEVGPLAKPARAKSPRKVYDRLGIMGIMRDNEHGPRPVHSRVGVDWALPQVLALLHLNFAELFAKSSSKSSAKSSAKFRCEGLLTGSRGKYLRVVGIIVMVE